jgi:Ni/Co efflux regulator RcnB
MNANAIVSALLAMSMTVGVPAFAQDGGDRTGHDRADQAQQNNNRDSRRNQARPAPRQRQDRSNRSEQSRGRGAGNDRAFERGAGPDHAFHRGGRLPPEYRNRSYVVDDWRAHGLSTPPRGYHWVQTGADYVLVAIATGIILQILLNN